MAIHIHSDRYLLNNVAAADYISDSDRLSIYRHFGLLAGDRICFQQWRKHSRGEQGRYCQPCPVVDRDAQHGRSRETRRVWMHPATHSD